MSTDAVQAIRNHVNVGQLVDFQWRLGVMLSSQDCRSLNTPYVTLALTVAESNGQQKKISLELTLPEFQSLHQQLKEIYSLLSTM